MAQNAPKSVEIEDIQFKLRYKLNIFQENDNHRGNVNLLATASNYGMVFVGDPYSSIIKVLPLPDTNSLLNENKFLAREIALPGIPNNIAISCDGSMLAVNFNLQNSSFLSIYATQTFLSETPIVLSNIPLVSESEVFATHLLWNPVISNTIAIILSNGALLMINLKNPSFELLSLDKSEQAKCACWSPKGKQIVVGFPSGKLIQFKPDLKPARTIICPQNVHDDPFDTIAIQWLSTYQFAVSFLQNAEDVQPCLYIVNAPKVGNPVYINYYDICFSSSGPRKGQIFLNHIQTWNLLLVASANSMEMGILGTTETGELPTWCEYTMSDDSVRLALPMSIDKEETYPIGIVLETGTTHQVTINEKEFPTMPMIHILSTYGQLVSFDFLNMRPNTLGICSPPQIGELQGAINLFKAYDNNRKSKHREEIVIEKNTVPLLKSDSSFMENFGAATSTPAPKPKAPSFFGSEDAPAAPLTFGITEKKDSGTKPTSFESKNAPSFQGFGQLSNSNALQVAKTSNQFAPGNSLLAPTNPIANNTKPKTVQPTPLFTIPPTFTPSPTNNPIKKLEPENKSIVFADPNAINVIKEMILTEIDCFESESNLLLKKSSSIDASIGNMEISKDCTKRLDNLRNINEFIEKYQDSQIKILSHGVTESFVMIEEAKSRLKMFENQEISRLITNSGYNQTCRRQLTKLNSFISANQHQLKIIQQKLDSNWAMYQDLVHQNEKPHMYVPNLEGTYIMLTMLKDNLAKQRKKINYIKSKLNLRDLYNNNLNDGTKNKITCDSITDLMMSVGLSEQVAKENARLTMSKLQAIRDATRNRNITKVKPHRPERLKSEVVLECQVKAERKRDGAITKPEKMMFPSRIEDGIISLQTLPQQTNQHHPMSHLSLPKPAATKPSESKTIFKPSLKTEQIEQNQNNVNFSGLASSFGVAGKQTLEVSKSQSTIFTQPEPSVAASIEPTFSFNMKTTKPISSNVFVGNTSEKSAFAVPPVFGGFSLNGTSKVENTTLNFVPAANNLFSGKGTSHENSNIFTSIAAPLSSSSNSKFEMNPVSSTGTESGFDLLAGNKQITSTTADVSKFKPSPGKPTLSDQTNELFGNINICKPTAVAGKNIPTDASDKKVENIFSMPEPTSNTTFTGFSGFNAVSTKNISNSPSTFTTVTSTIDINKTLPVQKPLSLGETKPNATVANSASVTDESKPFFSFGELTKSLGNSETPKTIFAGFNEQDSKSGEKPKTFTGFNLGAMGGFSGFGSTTTTSTTTKSSPFNAFNFSAAPSGGTKEFAGFGETINAVTIEKKPQFTGFGTTLNASISETTNDNTTIATTETPPDTSNASNTTSTKVSTSTTSSESSDTSTVVSSGTTSTFGSMNFKTPLQFGNLPFLANTSTQISTVTTPTVTSTNFYQPPATDQKPTESIASQPPIFSIPATSTSVINFGLVASPTTTAPSQSLFNAALPSLGFGTSTVSTTATTTVTTTTTVAFGGLSTVTTTTTVAFGNLSPTTASTNIFSGAVTTSTTPFTASPITSSSSIFGGIPAQTPNQNNIFAAAAAENIPTTTVGIFGGIPKPDQSVFASSPFGGQSNTGSIFATNTNQSTSPFGQTSAFNAGTTGGSIFGGQNVFGQSGSSIFGQQPSNFDDQQSQSIFGGASNSGGFGGGSIFSGNNSTQISGFGSGPFSTNAIPGGAFSAFGTTAPASPGAFAQGGLSVAQTGFGSPNSPFSKPVTGFGAPTFGGSPTFGSSPAFGGPATFGGFGSPQTGTTGAAFSPPTQKNNLFETLGSSGESVSFGNLAQNVNQNAGNPNFPSGSSFSSWR